MGIISIRERGLTTDLPVVVIEGHEHPLSHGIEDPFSASEEERLEWYFEEYPGLPFVNTVDARRAAESITTYGESLFRQVFADPRALRHYRALLSQDSGALSFEIVGSPGFHHLHWEALKDPDLPQILQALGRSLFGAEEYERQLQPRPEPVQQEMITKQLRAQRHLLILDNLEFITRAPMAVPNALTPAEQSELQDLLTALVGGRTLVLLGSRGEEGWLSPGTFEENRYHLQGLDAEAVAALADRVLARHGASQYREHPELHQLLRLLDGYPLAIEVVLSNLARQSPKEVLATLEAGLGEIGAPGDAEDMLARRTRSLLACIGSSHSNLSQARSTCCSVWPPSRGASTKDGSSASISPGSSSRRHYRPCPSTNGKRSSRRLGIGGCSPGTAGRPRTSDCSRFSPISCARD